MKLNDSDSEWVESLTLVMRYCLQHFLFQGFLVESECQDDGRGPFLPPQLLTDTDGGDVQVQVIGVKHHGPVQRVDEEPLGCGGCPAAACEHTWLPAIEHSYEPV